MPIILPFVIQAVLPALTTIFALLVPVFSLEGINKVFWATSEFGEFKIWIHAFVSRR